MRSLLELTGPGSLYWSTLGQSSPAVDRPGFVLVDCMFSVVRYQNDWAKDGEAMAAVARAAAAIESVLIMVVLP